MTDDELEKIKLALEKTGHQFEHQIGMQFERKGWMIIPNKFYLDRDDNKGHEIDLVAYRISEVRDRTAYITVVVIEAKQSTKNKWVFYTKGGYSGDINMQTAPLFYHNEVEEIGRYMDQSSLLGGMAERDQLDLFNFPRKAYSFSEITNDRQGKHGGSYFRAIATNTIYNAIFGVIKAQMSELDFYRNRKIARDEKRCYLVLPLVVFNGDMMEAQIERDGQIDLQETTEIQYINRYRSPAYDNFHSVNIIQRSVLPHYIDLFSDIHHGIADQAKRMIDRFYEHLDLTSFELLWDRVIDRLHQDEQFAAFNPGNLIPHHFNQEKAILEIYVDDHTLYRTLTTRPIFDFTQAMEGILTEVCGKAIRPQFKNHSKILNP